MSGPRRLDGSVPDDRNECLQAALAFDRLGLCVIPIEAGTKVAKSWKRYQDERPSEATIRRWFANGSSHSLALVMGPVSDGLICRDFDDLNAYELWAAEYPEFARTLPTAETGGGGRHVYGRASSEAIESFGKGYVKFDDGELRLRNCYCVSPPSTHPDGGNYRWGIPLSPDIPAIDIHTAGFAKQYVAATESHGENRDDRDHRGNRSTQSKLKTTDAISKEGERKQAPLALDSPASLNGSVLSASLCCTDDFDDWPQEVQKAIRESLPNGPRKRNRMVFELARALKAIPELSEAPANDLKAYVRQWHRLAASVIATQAFEETWIDFLRAWPRVKFPKGNEPIMTLLVKVKESKLPDIAMQYEQEPLQWLVALCRELQRTAGANPFYLSCRTAGRLLAVDHTTASRWLFLLVSDGVLIEVEKGSQQGRRATRYKYVKD
jgi:hypothetical protein